MIGRPALDRRDRQITQPHDLLPRRAGPAIAPEQAAREVVDIFDQPARPILHDALAVAIDAIARRERADRRPGEAIARVIGEGECPRLARQIARRVMGDRLRRAGRRIHYAGQAIAGRRDRVGRAAVRDAVARMIIGVADPGRAIMIFRQAIVLVVGIGLGRPAGRRDRGDAPAGVIGIGPCVAARIERLPLDSIPEAIADAQLAYVVKYTQFVSCHRNSESLSPRPVPSPTKGACAPRGS
jgi:hypothetical protein